MFITPTVVKAEAKSKVFTIHEKPVVNLKSYCHSNVQNMGEWRMTTQSVHEEMIGPAAHSQSKDEIKIKEDASEDGE